MDKIWDRKSKSEVIHWPLWRGWKKRMTTQNQQKSNAKKKYVFFSKFMFLLFQIGVYVSLLFKDKLE